MALVHLNRAPELHIRTSLGETTIFEKRIKVSKSGSRSLVRLSSSFLRIMGGPLKVDRHGQGEPKRTFHVRLRHLSTMLKFQVRLTKGLPSFFYARLLSATKFRSHLSPMLWARTQTRTQRLARCKHRRERRRSAGVAWWRTVGACGRCWGAIAVEAPRRLLR